MEIVGSHIIDRKNLGDRSCCTLSYFPFGSKHFDIRGHPEVFQGKHVIIGGGGLLHKKYEAVFKALLAFREHQSPDSKLIFWGAGINIHGASSVEYPEWLAQFDLVGLRDYGNPYAYVPCASCVNVEFDRPRSSVVHEWVVYEHKNVPIRSPWFSKVPRLNNCGKLKLGDTLDFLSKGKNIITNSFHGAYWSLLLGRDVWLYKPFSNRFLSFPVRLPAVKDEPIEEYPPTPRIADYLTECRQRNHAFALQVRRLLKLPT